MTNIHQRPKRVPKLTPPKSPIDPPRPSAGVKNPPRFTAEQTAAVTNLGYSKTASVIEDLQLPPHEIKRREIQMQHPDIPLEDIFVDKHNGVILFRNPATGGWLTNPKNRELGGNDL